MLNSWWRLVRPGKGTFENNAEALRWYRIAAERGDADSNGTLVLYEDGEALLSTRMKLKMVRAGCQSGKEADQKLLNQHQPKREFSRKERIGSNCLTSNIPNLPTGSSLLRMTDGLLVKAKTPSAWMLKDFAAFDVRIFR